MTFATETVQRYDPAVVTHVFIGNETDQFLRQNPDHQAGFISLMDALGGAVAPIDKRARLGTIFTFTADHPGYNDLAKKVAPLGSEAQQKKFTDNLVTYLKANSEEPKEAFDAWVGAE